MAFAQVFRGPNTTPPTVVFPPRQDRPLLNNGSLYTFVNPSFQNPSQLQFAYIAVAPQDCRLYHNGATIMPEHRLMGSLCLDSRIMPQQIQLTQGFIPQLPNGGLINMGNGGGNGGGAGGAGGNNIGGPGQGWTMTRPFTPAYYSPYPSYYGSGFDTQRGYGGMDFPYGGANLQTVAANNQPPAAPINFLNNGNPPNANGFFGLGNFGGNNNPFDIFNKKDDDKDADKDKKDAKNEDKKDAKSEDKKDAKEEKKAPLK
jgi:hypothetical protein